MEDERAVVAFNGEIFNYRELRRDLSGYRFKTDGDTEVLLAVYARYGAEGVARLRGQFAFAVFDKISRDLLLFRDPMGVLPLYYTASSTTLLFSSEIKGILAAPDASPRVDPESLSDYLSYRSVPAPDTLFEGVKKLEPGRYLRITGDGAITSRQYWRIPVAAAPRAVRRASVESSVNELAGLLDDAVESRLVADVPVGAYLSGGVDSSLIVAIMSKVRKGAAFPTYSAGFGDPRFDELAHARRVSEQFGTVHNEIHVRAEDFREHWERLTWHRDAPLSEPADIAVFKLAELAARDVKVLLSGEGSDELFGGYPKHRAAKAAALAGFIPHGVRELGLRTLEQRLPPSLTRLRIAARALSGESEADRARDWFAPFTTREVGELTGLRGRGQHRHIYSRSGGDSLQRQLYLDCHAWLVDNLLERGDRMAMAASVESRPPLLDTALCEFAFSLPSRLKVRRGVGKWILKEVARRHLPVSIVDRTKVGFRVPLDRWFQGGLRDFAGDLLLGPGSFVGEALDRKRVEALFQRHDSNRSNEEIRIWTLLGLEVWHRVFFSSPTSGVGGVGA